MAYPILAQRDEWFTQGNSGIKRSSITEIDILNTYTPTVSPTAQWDGSAAKDGSITVYVEGTKLTIAGNGSGKVQANANSTIAFSSPGSVKDFYANLSVFNPKDFYTGKVETFTGTFQKSGLVNIDFVSRFDFSSCKNIQQMFVSCLNLKEIKLPNLTFPMVENAYAVFKGCGIQQADISGWYLPAVKKFGYIFGWCADLIECNMSKIRLPVAETLSHMFADCSKLVRVDFSDLSAPKILNYGAMFNDCASLETVDISSLTAPAQAFAQMFERCTKLRRVDGLSKLHTESASYYQDPSIGDKQGAFGEMFWQCSSLEELDFSKIDTRKARIAYSDTLANLFTDMSKLSKVTLGKNFDWTGGNPSSPPEGENIPILPTPDPAYIPGADGNWYDLSGKAYTPLEAIKTVPNTYYASKTLVNNEPIMLKNGIMIGIGEAIRNKRLDGVYRHPNEMKTAIEGIPAGSGVGQYYAFISADYGTEILTVTDSAGNFRVLRTRDNAILPILPDRILNIESSDALTVVLDDGTPLEITSTYAPPPLNNYTITVPNTHNVFIMAGNRFVSKS